MTAQTQTHGFKAEVQQLLTLMIHSVYSDREVFLRELVSNSADALDKARFIGLTDSELVPPGTDNPGVRVTVDEEAGTVTIDDDGIGMSEEEVVNNLGTIAKSGTRAFLDQVKEAADAPKLIGQFGLGFYSAFMVAHRVDVETRSAHAEAPAVLWSSSGEGTYEVSEGEREHRGTSITLHLRDDAKDFADTTKLAGIVRKHSNFLQWPITVGEDQANSGRALWMEPPATVSEEESNQFYKTVATDWRDPAVKVHVSVDSPIQYRALLFVPGQRPHDLFYPDMKKGPRLYVRRVLIDEHASGMLPDWLRFVRGVVDSEDIPLNVSREMIQKTVVVQKIKKQLTKRILKSLGRFANRPPDEPEEPEEVAEGEEPPLPAPPKPTYDDVWRNFGSLLKEGYYHDKQDWGEALLPLFRFNALSHAEADELMSLADYVAAMPEGQEDIWYITAESREGALASPHLEAFRKRGWDVLLFTDTVDEWFAQSLDTVEGKSVKSVARGELAALDEEEEEDDASKKVDLEAFTPWVQSVLGDAVGGVRGSSRLTDSACVLVDDEHGMSANMERILRSANQDVFGGAKRVLEVNPKHPLILSLAALHESGKSAVAEPMVRMLLDDALLLEGTVRDAQAMGRRLQDLLQAAAAAAVGSEASA
ncbi:MAG: molecular chaperone HtpG [Myxococcota bacterium]|jgi:molecular chaperone HtpG